MYILFDCSVSFKMCFKNIYKRLFMSKYRLEDINFEDTIPFVPTITHGKVVKIYDGDTFTIASRLMVDEVQSEQVYRFSVRIKGIDTPEIKTKNANEKSLAIIARDALRSKIEGRIVELKNVELEKYGRILADIYIDGLDVGKWMLDSKYAVSYNGGTKKYQMNGPTNKRGLYIDSIILL